ncbi:MAG: hypothetical protein H5U38_03330 [Calditrichaeota bacterium]|nr:hypothetical protein [Calditrichota bacterium]
MDRRVEGVCSAAWRSAEGACAGRGGLRTSALPSEGGYRFSRRNTIGTTMLACSTGSPSMGAGDRRVVFVAVGANG